MATTILELIIFLSAGVCVLFTIYQLIMTVKYGVKDLSKYTKGKK